MRRITDGSEDRYRMARRDHAVVGAATAVRVEALVPALPGSPESQCAAEVIGLRIAGRPRDVRVPRTYAALVQEQRRLSMLQADERRLNKWR